MISLFSSRGMAAAVLACALVCPAGAETKNSDIKETLNHIWHDQRRMVTAPLRINRTDMVVWGGAAGTLLLFAPEWGGNQSLDERFEQGINRPAGSDAFLRGLTHVGDAQVLIGTSLLGYGAGRLSGNAHLQRGSLHLFEGLIDTGIIVELSKILFGRVRPIHKPVDSQFKGPAGYFKNPSENSSFPSGHSAMSFAAATIISHEYKSYWVGVPAYVVASGVAYSRIYVEKHWFSDVVAGAALGYSIGVLIEKHRHAKSEHAGRIYPTVKEDVVGLAWTRQF